MILYFFCSTIAILLLGLNSESIKELDCNWLEYLLIEEKMVGALIAFVSPFFNLPFWGYTFGFFGIIIYQHFIYNWPEGTQGFLIIYAILVVLSIIPFWLLGMHFYIIVCIANKDYY